jgi:hypothetical protein
VGMLIIVLLWTSVAIYNESSRTDFAPNKSIHQPASGAADR